MLPCVLFAVNVPLQLMINEENSCCKDQFLTIMEVFYCFLFLSYCFIQMRLRICHCFALGLARLGCKLLH